MFVSYSMKLVMARSDRQAEITANSQYATKVRRTMVTEINPSARS
jgi:hypothetical protein